LIKLHYEIEQADHTALKHLAAHLKQQSGKNITVSKLVRIAIKKLLEEYK